MVLHAPDMVEDEMPGLSVKLSIVQSAMMQAMVTVEDALPETEAETDVSDFHSNYE